MALREATPFPAERAHVLMLMPTPIPLEILSLSFLNSWLPLVSVPRHWQLPRRG